MAFHDIYKKQVELLVRALPYVAKEDCFALKGGTAINLFVRNLPRLSVDIDLTFLPRLDRNQALAEIEGALKRIAKRLKQSDDSIQVAESAPKTQPTINKLVLRATYSRQPEWELLGVEGVQNLPAVKWREVNLDRAGPETRAELVEKLEEVLTERPESTAYLKSVASR